MNKFKNKTLLITGGTGSFGHAFLKEALNKKYNFKKLIIYSRDELKQFKMQEIPLFQKNLTKLRFFIGDIRDEKRLKLALNEVDYVIHAAALKQVPTAEYNPFEVIKTNIIGAQNLISAALETNVKKIVALSTDKASSPINLYGATKLCSDKLFVSAKSYAGSKNINFSVVRYGNVMGSRGSVIPKFLNDKLKKQLNITNKDMTRFNLTLEESVDLVFWTLKYSFGSEIIVPKIPSYKIMDLAKSICPECKIKITGIRPGEKKHEEMISKEESRNTLELKDKFIIFQDKNKSQINFYKKKFKGSLFKKDFSYNSKENKVFLNSKELKELIYKQRKNIIV